jgi:Flp pilus assembly pilin Flp
MCRREVSLKINVTGGKMKNQIKRFFAEESGQDVAEYAMLLVLVAIAIAIASPTITDSVLSVFSRTKSVLGV